jgi:hypothetical protein
VAVAGERTAAAERVIQQQSSADVGALPEPVLERVEEGHRRHQVRCQPGQHELALSQGFPDEAKIKPFQITQATVEELAGSR